MQSAKVIPALIPPRKFEPQTRTRFLRRRYIALVEQFRRTRGREPGDTETLRMQRVIEIEWGLRRDDARIARGEQLAEWELRERRENEILLRIGLAELDGTRRLHERKPPPPPARSLTELLQAEVDEDQG